MNGFDTVLVVDWSAAKRAPARASKDAIWLGLTREGISQDPVYCRTRSEAEVWIKTLMQSEQAAGRRLLASFDFPFGYPTGFAHKVTGTDDPLRLWDWFEQQITDAPDGTNNRFDVAERLNALFDGPGPFWGKSHRDRWPGLPYRKDAITFDPIAEKRSCDRVAKAASSCFQMSFPPTVGGQIMMGLPMLARLRRMDGVAVWPFEPWEDAPVVLAEIWPGIIEAAVKEAGGDEIRDRAQVRLLADALARVPAATLAAHMADVPAEAREEAWILGTGMSETLCAFATANRPLRNDCFALPPGVKWTQVDEALALLRDRLSPVAQIETVPLAQALGRVAAQDVVARRANPPMPNTAVDGYGFAGGRAAGAHRLPLVAERAAAGDAPGILPPNHAIRVLTGAALPEGVDTVILQEDCTVDENAIEFNGPVKMGANTRKAGEDVQADEAVLGCRRRIMPADLALMAATGVHQVAVRQALRVGILSTGNELVEVGADAQAGQIFDANRPMLAGLMARLGYAVEDLGRVPDNRDLLRQTLDSAVGRVDAILTSGGASAGDEDHVSALLNEAGAMTLWRIAIKPGRPLALGMWRGLPVFGLPGNPVAAMVCALVFTRPALGLMAGEGWLTPQGFDVPAGFSKAKKAGRREYLRARIREGQAEVFASEGSGRISGLSWAEGLVDLGEDVTEVAQGDLVRYIPWGSFGI